MKSSKRAPGIHLVHRYFTGQFYSVTYSKRISLQQIKLLARFGGQEFHIIDKVTQQDLTKEVLK